MLFPEPTEEYKQFSIHLHKRLCQAGFTSERVRLQSLLVDHIENLYKELYDEDQYQWRIAGSYGDVWGNNLFTFDGRTDEHESDVDWTCVMHKSVFHFKETCKCSNRDEKYVISTEKLNEGHVSFLFQQLREPAEPHEGIGLRPKVDECTAYPCCSVPLSIFCEHVSFIFDPKEVALKMQLIQASRPGHENSELRFGFAAFEKTRIRALDLIQGHLFILIKYFVTNKLNKDIFAFKSYHAKTLLFFILYQLRSEPNVWKPENLVSLLLDSFDFLIDQLKQRRDSGHHAAMSSLFLKDCYIYFHKKVFDSNPHDSLIKVIEEAKKAIINHLREYISMLRPIKEENEGLIFHPYVLFPTRLTLQFYKPINSENLYLRLQSCLQELMILKEENKVNFLRHIESLPPKAFTASICLKIMTHLKFGDRSAAIELLRVHQFHTAQYVVPVRPISSSIQHELESMDTAWCFAFTYDTMQAFNFEFLDDSEKNRELFKHCITCSTTYPVDVIIDFNCLCRLFYILLCADRSVLDQWHKDLARKQAPLSEVYLYYYFATSNQSPEDQLPKILDSLHSFITEAIFDRMFLPRLVRGFDKKRKTIFSKWLNNWLESHPHDTYSEDYRLTFIELFCATFTSDSSDELIKAEERASKIAQQTLHYQDFLLLLKMKRRLCKLKKGYLDSWWNRINELKEDKMLNVEEILAFIKAGCSAKSYHHLTLAFDLMKESDKVMSFLKLKDFRLLVNARQAAVNQNPKYLYAWLKDVVHRADDISPERAPFFIIELRSLVNCVKHWDKSILSDCRSIINKLRGTRLDKADAAKVDRLNFALSKYA